MAAKFILPAIALAGTVLAQCDGPSITITTSADAGAISTCKTYNGDVIISPDASGTVALNGVQNIKGDLTCNNATQLTAITSDQLATISGLFSLTGLTILSTLQFDSLNGVNEINWVSLPALQALNFAQGISQANQVYISDTQLTSLSGIELAQVGSMNINNNKYLSTINVNSLTNVTNALAFSANSADLAISFPNLEGAANLTFRNVSSVEMPSLSNVAGDMGFYSNTFEQFSAPNLTMTGGTLAFVDSPSLSSLDFPALTTVGGGLLLANNTKLASIVGFPKLKTIVGAIDFAGDFGSVALPSLTDVRGGSNVQTTSSNTTICNLFNTAADHSIIKGVNNCQTGKANPTTNSSSSSTGGSSSSSGTGTSDAISFNPSGPLTGIAALVAAMLLL